MANIDENEIEREILPFLLPSSRPDLRAIAVRYFLGLTGTDEGRQVIVNKPRYVQLLADLIDDECTEIAKDVTLIILNIAADIDVVGLLSSASSSRLISHLLKSALCGTSDGGGTAAMVLSNLSRSEQSASTIASLMLKEPERNFSIYRVVDVLCKSDGQTLEHLASFLSNLTQVLDVRRLILDKDRCLIQRLFPFINCADSLTKRSGVVAAVRNCCFETDSHEWLLSDKVDILPRLLLPLAGPEEFDEDDMEKLPVDLQYLEPSKVRESDINIRRMLVESVNQLCALKSCRQFIIEKNTYIILRELHKWETDESNLVAIENLISVLISDEPEPGMENLNEVVIPENVATKLTKAAEDHKSESKS